MRFIRFGLLFLSVVLSFQSIAETPYYYVGVAAQEQSTRSVNFSPDTAIENYNNIDYTAQFSGTAYRLFAGYSFNNYIATEIDYTSYEKQEFTMVSNNGGDIDLAGSSDSQSLGMQAVVNLPFRQDFSVRLKLGVIAWHNSLDTLSLVESQPSVSNDDSTGFEVSSGLGFHYALTRRVSFIFDWDNRPVKSANVESIGLSLAYAF
ncbi:MAG: outer membrane beta-barrel protein [Gammaproteobacteria bacterium]|nr:outer membrane beta-barrel protein [Gammaproteobacteria bacterium]